MFRAPKTSAPNTRGKGYTIQDRDCIAASSIWIYFNPQLSSLPICRGLIIAGTLNLDCKSDTAWACLSAVMFFRLCNGQRVYGACASLRIDTQRAIHDLSNPNDGFFLKCSPNDLESDRGTFVNAWVVYE